MTDGAAYAGRSGPRTGAGVLTLPLIAAASALLAFAALQLAAAATAGWVFEYPLDDVYIHLAMAEEIARGGYGVNAGEYASAASSPLYPLLLTPFAGTEAQRVLPLLWNMVGLVLSALAFGRALALAGLSAGAQRGLGIAVAVAGPVMLNMPGVAFTGMEHSLHAAVTLWLVLGLWQFLQTGRAGALLLVCMVLGPAFRLEGLALSLLAAGLMLLRGRILLGLGMGALVLAPVAGFAAFLVSLGLDPLPSSVLTKMNGSGASGLARIATGLTLNLLAPGGKLLAALAFLVLLLPRLVPGGMASDRRLFGAALFLAAIAHLLVAQIGWMDRYEHYMIAALVTGTVLLAFPRPAAEPSRLAPALLLAAVAGAGLVYLPPMLMHLRWAPRAIHLQQGQMARFAQDFARVPVAVNDLGRVAWTNPDHVLDLWGLASGEARRVRLSNPPPGWGAALAQAKGVRLAMIYDSWLGDAVPPDWQRLGVLSMDNPRGYLGGREVAFYATSAADVPMLRQAMERFIPTLPAPVHLTLAEAAQ